MRRVLNMFSRAAKPPSVRLPTSDPVIMKLPHIEGVQGSIAYGISPERADRKVVCVHGCPGNIGDFRYLAAQLEMRGCEVLRIDLPGHAMSEDAAIQSHPHSHALAKVACHCVVDLMGSSVKPLLVSHSLGSHVALEMIKENPTMFSGLVMICPAGLQPHASLRPWGAIRYIAEMFLHHPTSFSVKVMSMFLPTAYQIVGFKKMPVSELIYCQQRVATIDFEGLQHSVKEMASHDFPVHVAYAVDDPMCNKEVCKELSDSIKESIGHARYSVAEYPSGGHALQKWKSAEIAETCVDMFDD